MLVDFIGEESEISRAIEYLNKNGIEVEKKALNQYMRILERKQLMTASA